MNEQTFTKIDESVLGVLVLDLKSLAHQISRANKGDYCSLKIEVISHFGNESVELSGYTESTKHVVRENFSEITQGLIKPDLQVLRRSLEEHKAQATKIEARLAEMSAVGTES